MVRLTAKEAAERLGVSYVIAAGIMTHLEDMGKAKVVEKKFHASGKGKPTRVYEVEDSVSLDFSETVAVAEPVTEETVAVAEPVTEETVVAVAEPVAEEPVTEKIETLDHVAAALARLKAENAA